jgi:hypothetical protein
MELQIDDTTFVDSPSEAYAAPCGGFPSFAHRSYQPEKTSIELAGIEAFDPA